VTSILVTGGKHNTLECGKQQDIIGGFVNVLPMTNEKNLPLTHTDIFFGIILGWGNKFLKDTSFKK